MKLIEPVELPEFGTRIGYVHIRGTGFRIGTETAGDGCQRHLSIAAARRLAKTYEATEHAEELKPVIEALRERADRLEQWLIGDALSPEAPEMLRDLQPEGHA